MPIIALAILLTAFFCAPAAAWWSDDPAENTPVCTETQQQNSPAMAGDGVGGAIIAWADQRNGMWSTDIYAQRLDAQGRALWTGNGIAVCSTPGTVSGSPAVLADGAGGAFITWHDYRSGNADIYIQRVDGNGDALWAVNGLGICTAADEQWDIRLVSDEAGGVIAVWRDSRPPGMEDIYAQRVNSSGTPLWAADGLPVCTAAGEQSNIQAVAGGDSGVIVAWNDNRVSNTWDVYLQKLDKVGTQLWAADGVAASTAGGYQFGPVLAGDGIGGAICAWQDSRDPTRRIYAQRITSAGSAAWATDGILIEGNEYSQFDPCILTDGSGGAFIAWGTNTGTYWFDIYAQRVDAAGSPLWAAGGRPVCTAPDDQNNPQISGDGDGAVITWEDQRDAVDKDYDIYGQRIDGDGNRLWDPAGVAIATAEDYQSSSCLTGDTAGGVILAFVDWRGSAIDIYAQQVSANGFLGNINPETVQAGLTCIPTAGTLPFTTQMTVTLNNFYTGQTRRVAAVIDVELASGATYGNWRAGYTNIAAGGDFSMSWMQSIPAMGSLVGLNVFNLHAEDVTPAPYNQQPYPASGCSATSSCTIEGLAP